MYSQGSGLPHQRHAVPGAGERHNVPAQYEQARLQQSFQRGHHVETNNFDGQGKNTQRDYHYDARYRGNGDVRSQSSLGVRHDNGQRSRDAQQPTQQFATDRRLKPRDRILVEPDSPVTLAWDNPFGAFPTKKPVTANTTADLPGTDPQSLSRPQPSQDHSRREEPYNRPQTSQDHQRRNDTYNRPQTSQDHRRDDRYNRPPASQGIDRQREESYDRSRMPRGAPQRAENKPEHYHGNAPQPTRNPPVDRSRSPLPPDQIQRKVSRQEVSPNNQVVSDTRRPFPERPTQLITKGSDHGHSNRQESYPRSPLPSDQNQKHANKQIHVPTRPQEIDSANKYTSNSHHTHEPQRKVLQKRQPDRAPSPLPPQQNRRDEIGKGTAQISTRQPSVPLEPDMPLRKIPPSVVGQDLNTQPTSVAHLPLRPDAPQRSMTQPTPGNTATTPGYGNLSYEPRAANNANERPSTSQTLAATTERRPSAPAHTQRFARQVSEEKFDPSSYRGVPLNKPQSHQSSEMPNFDSIATPTNEKSETLLPIPQKSQYQTPVQPAYVKQTYQSSVPATGSFVDPPKKAGSVRIPIDRSGSSSQTIPGRFDKLAANQVSFGESQARETQLRKGSATSVNRQKLTAGQPIHEEIMPIVSTAPRSFSQEHPVSQKGTTRFPPRNASKYSNNQSSGEISGHRSQSSEQSYSQPSTMNDVYNDPRYYNYNGDGGYAYENAIYDDDHIHDYYDPAQEVYPDQSQYYDSHGYPSHGQAVPQQLTSSNHLKSDLHPGTSDSARTAPVRQSHDSNGTSNNTPVTLAHNHNAHPVPFRPGLISNAPQPAPPEAASPALQAPAPTMTAPPREATVPKVAQIESKENAVTIDELNRYREAFKNDPNDYPLGLKFAKRLVEAATVLASENGRADAKQTAKNRERYIMDAYKLVKKLVGANYIDAMFYLADCHGQGLLGLAQDPKEAFQLYQSAAKLGHPQSAYRVAVCCEMGNEEGGGTRRDPAKAFQWYKRAATLGDTPAMYKMGIVLLKGLLGQPRNPRDAVSWLKRAAERAEPDNPHALHELALLYESAQPTDHIVRDEKYALQLFTQAADLGYKYSQFRLGSAYEYGLLGCPTDPRHSITWYSRAAAQGEHQSELALSGWYLTGSPPLLAQSDTEAFLWARKAAMSGLARAEYAMGYFTEVGIGTTSDTEEAKRWYYRAAAQNLPKAKERLEDLRRGGKMTKTRVSRSNVEKHNEGDCVVM